MIKLTREQMDKYERDDDEGRAMRREIRAQAQASAWGTSIVRVSVVDPDGKIIDYIEPA